MINFSLCTRNAYFHFYGLVNFVFTLVMFWSALEARDLHQLVGWSRIPVHKHFVHNVLQVTSFRTRISKEDHALLLSLDWLYPPETVATLPQFGPIEGQKWFDQISSQ
jgi:hypothetical protein